MPETMTTAVRPARPSRRMESHVVNPTVRTISALAPVTKKRVAAYARVSTDAESQEGSYDLQVDYYTDYISRHDDWTLVKVFADEGKTGTSTSRRTEFKAMIADCEAGKIDMILTKSISRFARNTLDCLETVRKLKNLPKPVGVYFEKEAIDTLDGRSELLLTILSSLAQDESRSISENIRWSLQKLYESGYVHCPTTRLLGYDTVIDPETGKKRMVIEPVGASVVRMIYEMFLNGSGYAEIAYRMEQLGAKTGAGNDHWTATAVQRILQNEKYVGDAITQKGYTKDFLSHQRLANQGQMPRYYAEGHHEAIIDRAAWNSVQEKIKAGIGAEQGGANVNPVTGCAPHRSGKTVFSSKLFCGNCGSPLIRRSMASHAGSVRGTRCYLWKCRNAEGRGDGTCHAKAIPELVLEQTFMEMLSRLAGSPREELEAEFLMANGIQACSETIDQSMADNLRLELANINDQIQTMVSEPDLYADMLEELRARADEIKTALNPAIDWSTVNPLKKTAFDWFLEQIQAIPRYDFTSTTIPFRSDVYDRCIECGEVREVKDEHGVVIDIAIRYTFTFGLEATAYGNRRSMATARRIQETMEKGRGAASPCE